MWHMVYHDLWPLKKHFGESFSALGAKIYAVITSAKEVMFSVALVCLFVRKIIEKVMNGFWSNLLETSGGGQVTSD